MLDQKATALGSASTPLQDTDTMYLVRSGGSFKTTAAALSAKARQDLTWPDIPDLSDLSSLTGQTAAMNDAHPIWDASTSTMKQISREEMCKFYKDGLPGSGVSWLMRGDLSGAPTADETAVAVYGYTHNTGNVVGGTGHLIGVVGRVDDGVNGKHDLIGVEGRIDSAGSAGALTGVFSFSTFYGSSFGVRENRGFYARVLITSDGSSPIGDGIAIAYKAERIVGGAIRYSFVGYDPIRIESEVQCFDPSGVVYSRIYNDGTDFRIDGGSGAIRLIPFGANFVIVSNGIIGAEGWVCGADTARCDLAARNSDFSSQMRLRAIAAPSSPPAGSAYLYLDSADNTLKVKKSDGTVVSLEA
jgi:hypothetical protein